MMKNQWWDLTTFLVEYFVHWQGLLTRQVQVCRVYGPGPSARREVDNLLPPHGGIINGLLNFCRSQSPIPKVFICSIAVRGQQTSPQRYRYE